MEQPFPTSTESARGSLSSLLALGGTGGGLGTMGGLLEPLFIEGDRTKPLGLGGTTGGVTFGMAS